MVKERNGHAAGFLRSSDNALLSSADSEPIENQSKALAEEEATGCLHQQLGWRECGSVKARMTLSFLFLSRLQFPIGQKP